MKLRSLLAATLVLCLFIGGGIYFSWPTATSIHDPPANTYRIPPMLEQMLEDWDKPSPEEIKRRNALLAKKIARIKKTQKVVNGMVLIKPGESGVVRCLWNNYGAGSGQANKYYIVDSTDGFTENGSVSPGGLNATWSAMDELFSDETFRSDADPSHPTNTIDVLVTLPSDVTEVLPPSNHQQLHVQSNDNNENGWIDGYSGSFTVTGDLTGTVSVSKVAGLQACIDLKADASEGQKVTSVDVDWGDGSSHYTTSPNMQHYFGGNICHTYTAADTYTITATYQDDDSHTIHPDTEVTVDCINSASMSIQSIGSSNGKNPANGIYTHCYTATVSHSTAAGESYSYDWTFPDNTTVNSGGGSSDQTASFCIATTNISAPSNFGVVSCEITKTTPTPPCDVTVSGQLAGPGGPPSPPPAGPPPGDAPPTSGPLC